MTDPFGQGVALANPSATPASEPASQTSATCGPLGSGSSASVALSRLLVSKLRRRLGTAGSTLYSMTWKEKATPARRLVSLLAASAPRTSASDCSGWLTAQSRDGAGNRGGSIKRTGGQRRNLDDYVMLAGWVSPTARDGRRGGLPPRPHDTGVPLSQQVTLAGYPTPCATDHKGPNPLTRPVVDDDLPTRVARLGVSSNGSPAPTESRGQLNPDFSRWLMGYPDEWGSCAPTVTQLSRR